MRRPSRYTWYSRPDGASGRRPAIATTYGMSGRTKTFAYGAVGESSFGARSVVLLTLRASTTSNTTSSLAAASSSCARRLRSCASAALSDTPQTADAARSVRTTTAPARSAHAVHAVSARGCPRRATSRSRRARSSAGGVCGERTRSTPSRASPISPVSLSISSVLPRCRSRGSARDRAAQLRQREPRPFLHRAERRRRRRRDLGLREPAEVSHDDDAALFRGKLAHRRDKHGLALRLPAHRLDRRRGIGQVREQLLDLLGRDDPLLARASSAAGEDLMTRDRAEPRAESSALRIELPGLAPEANEGVLDHVVGLARTE